MKTTTIAALLCLATVAAPPRAAEAQTASDAKVFEMRTYTTAPGKLDTLNARFRNHTLALFKKHGMEVVGFWEPTDKEAGAGEKLVYILAHRSREAAAASWNAFRADPDWVKAKADSEKDGPVLTKIESVFLTGTDYSPIK
jgi:hypothetical protein